MKGKSTFNLEYQYQLYLQRVKLKESEMHPEQKKQLRQAFMGACGQLLVLLKDDLSQLEETEVMDVLEDMTKQVADYFITLSGRAN
jgi:hypothetical protein